MISPCSPSTPTHTASSPHRLSHPQVLSSFVILNMMIALILEEYSKSVKREHHKVSFESTLPIRLPLPSLPPARCPLANRPLSRAIRL